jgi:hypothetical protein
MASAEVEATGAVALLSSRGLDAAMQPFATSSPTEIAVTSRLAWVAPVRSGDERAMAKARAQGGAAVTTLTRRLVRDARRTNSKPGGRR